MEPKREMEPNTNQNDALHVAMLPYVAFGHMNPFIHLANKLSSHGFKISFFSASGNIPRIKSSLSCSPNISIIPFTLPRVDGLPAGVDSTADVDADLVELLLVAVDRTQPQIRALLSDLKPHIIFFDFVQHWIPSIASELGIKTVQFLVFPLVSVSYIFTQSRASTSDLPSIEDLKKPPKGNPNTLISMKTFQVEVMLNFYRRFQGNPSLLERFYTGMQGSDVIVFKSCHEIESQCWEYIKTQIEKPILLAGIPRPSSSSDNLDQKWSTWLAKFPSKSVIFCAFGTEISLNNVQIRELALGLEQTDLPFLMVLSSIHCDQERLQQALPEGFLERVGNRGMIHIGWVPQQGILAHENVGCYITHGGFESVTEAVAGECRLVLLPFKGDQFLNSKLLSLYMKVGVEVNRRDEDGYFGKEDVAAAVKAVMVEADEEPGKSIRASLGKWKELLTNKEFEEKYMLEMVKQLKALVGS